MVGVRLIGYLEGVFCFFMEVVNSQIAGTFKRCAECMMSNIGSHQKRITFLGTNPYPTPSEGTVASMGFPFSLRWEICDVIVLWKNKSQQQRTRSGAMETLLYALECESMSCLSNEWSYLAITWAFSLLVVDAWIIEEKHGKRWEDVGKMW